MASLALHSYSLRPGDPRIDPRTGDPMWLLRGPVILRHDVESNPRETHYPNASSLYLNCLYAWATGGISVAGQPHRV
eukprot:1426726-Prorocentrum_lima.AAC.1